ncbi:MAG: redoxin domain-containing protein, partial [Desulfobacterales bacterium]
MTPIGRVAGLFFAVLILVCGQAFGLSEAFQENVYNPGTLKPIDSRLKVKVGDPAPDFSLPSVSGERVTLSQYRGKKNVV